MVGWGQGVRGWLGGGRTGERNFARGLKKGDLFSSYSTPRLTSAAPLRAEPVPRVEVSLTVRQLIAGRGPDAAPGTDPPRRFLPAGHGAEDQEDTPRYYRHRVI